MSAGVVRVSAASEMPNPVPSSSSIAASSATPSRIRPTMRPNRNGMANGIRSRLQISSRFVNGVGFS